MTSKIRTQQGTRGYGGKEMEGCYKINWQQRFPHYRFSFCLTFSQTQNMDTQSSQGHRIFFVTHPEAVTAACDLRWLQAGTGQPVAIVCYLPCDVSMAIRAFRSLIKLWFGFATLRADDCRLRRNYFLHVCKIVGRRLFAEKMRKRMIYIHS